VTRSVHTVLFDLDGTLVDSAPDLSAVANQMLEARGRTPMSADILRCWAGSGARGMLQAAFGLAPGDAAYNRMRDEFHDRYERIMLDHSGVFPAIEPVLAALDAAVVPWGIVTNKALRFADPLVRSLGLHERAAVLVGGDSTLHTKPHPAPLIEAARRMKVSAVGCAYVGDDARDIAAGRAAGMVTLAAAWGYLGPAAVVTDWGADLILRQPDELLLWLDLA
jgi:N-acetyl-D-muramate 6-phosphate phosphatase